VGCDCRGGEEPRSPPETLSFEGPVLDKADSPGRAVEGGTTGLNVFGLSPGTMRDRWDFTAHEPSVILQCFAHIFGSDVHSRLAPRVFMQPT
jgi:hypothetical protein